MRGSQYYDWDDVLRWTVVGVVIVLVVLMITLATYYLSTQTHDLARTCIEHGGQWITGNCIRGAP